MISYACGYQEEEYLDPDQRDQEENAIKHCAHMSSSEMILARNGIALFSRKLRI